MDRGDLATARDLLEESLTIQRARGDQSAISHLLFNLSAVVQRQGDLAAARAHYEESLARYRALGDRRGVALGLCALGHVAETQGDFADARERFAESLALLRDVGDRRWTVAALRGLALVAAEQGQPQQATRLLGAAAALGESIDAAPSPGEREDIDRAVAKTREAMGASGFDAAWAAGRALTWDEAITAGLEPPAAPATTKPFALPLDIAIDEERRARQVAEITANDAFAALQERARRMRVQGREAGRPRR